MKEPRKCPRSRVDDGFVLEHADRLIFGPCYFVFVLPTICNADVLIASGEADFTLAQSPGSRGHVRWRLRMEEMREKRRVVDSFGDVEQAFFRLSGSSNVFSDGLRWCSEV